MSEKDILSGHQSLCDKRQKRIVSEEKRSSHTAVNKNGQLVRQYLIDGDVIKDKHVIKCDYLVLNDEKKAAYFIELKGSKVLHAIEQIEETAKRLRPCLLEYQFYYRIVFSGSCTHNVNGAEYLEWKLKHGRARGIDVASMKRGPYSETI